MKYPKLVPEWVCTTPIYLQIEQEGLTEDGEPLTVAIGSAQAPLMCNWQDGGRVRLTLEQRIVEVSGRAYFNGDICPSLSNITSGEGYVFGEKREILQGFKRRDPDGTVNYTEVHFK